MTTIYDVIWKVNIGSFNIAVSPQICQIAKLKPLPKLPAIMVLMLQIINTFKSLDRIP